MFDHDGGTFMRTLEAGGRVVIWLSILLVGAGALGFVGSLVCLTLSLT